MKRLAPLWSLLDRSDRRRLVVLSLASGVLAFLDMVGVTMVFPLVLLLASQNNAETPTMVKQAMDLTGFTTLNSVIALLVGLILVLFVVRGVSSIIVLRSTLRLALQAEARTAERILRTLLNAPLLYHVGTNSASAQRTLNESLRQVYQKGIVVLVPAIGDLGVVVLVSAMLIVVAPLEAFVGALCIGLVVVVYRQIAGRRAEHASEKVLARQRESVQYIQQSLTAVKEIQIRGTTDLFADDLLRVRSDAAEHIGRLQLIEYVPRYLLEMGMVLSAALVGTVAFLRNPADRALAIVVIFAAAIVRVLPSLNRVMVALMHLTSVQPGIRLVRAALTEFGQSEARPVADSRPMADGEPFEQLELRGVAFRYPTAEEDVFSEADLLIVRGDYIGIVGPSGAGKTTLLNVMLGFFEPTQGIVCVNGVMLHERTRSWRERVGYVPQDVAFLDGTIGQNVAFETRLDRIDPERVRRCLEVSQLGDVVDALPEGIDTPVREAGKALSGGQRQRIGLARALYNEPEVLVLDEATSALDGETESALLDAVDMLTDRVTVIIVAHRQSTVDRCRRVITVAEGVVQ